MKAPVTLVEPGTVRLERLLPGPLERVWAYVTSVSPPFQPQVWARARMGSKRVITPSNLPMPRSLYFSGVVFSEERLQLSNSRRILPPRRRSNSPAQSHLARLSDSVM